MENNLCQWRERDPEFSYKKTQFDVLDFVHARRYNAFGFCK